MEVTWIYFVTMLYMPPNISTQWIKVKAYGSEVNDVMLANCHISFVLSTPLIEFAWLKDKFCLFFIIM